ncbi:phosphate ABC transporter permease [Aliidiomarina taiwanensis]|uniref:Phosphate ABC transporter permease n=1 Tax=Aliidiomarina taiwanensis TaxID=946228 RepID=A0A432X1J2_9GAMM|nr:ABC transporter permease subunit [Aliidiomarina taiwanensis]RUO40128.1 phosphate ABC transporter permease [Aliidiomarina taiwanensis]
MKVTSQLPSREVREKRRRIRSLKDNTSRFGITAAGYGVVFSLALIFVYLFYEVLPILKGAEITPVAQYDMALVTQEEPSAQVLIERYQELGVNFTQQGGIRFFHLDSGEERLHTQVSLAQADTVSSFAAAESLGGLVAYGSASGKVQLLRPDYQLSFPNDQRQITPGIVYPYGEQPIQLDPQGAAIQHLSVQESTRGRPAVFVAGYTEDQRWLLAKVSTRENLFTGRATQQIERSELPHFAVEPRFIRVDKAFRNLYVAEGSRLHYFDISQLRAPKLIQTVDVGEEITALEFLVGSVSLVVGTETGGLSQWFPVRDEQNAYQLEHIRSFKQHPGAITTIRPEYTRKGFLAGDSAGYVGVHYATSSRTLLLKQMAEQPIEKLAVSPVNKAVLTFSGEQVQYASLWNQHPQLSFKALWNRVWYEGRSDPEYIWQSSSGNDEFESKFSLIPLSVGTLKAAFFAMLFAMPLGIMAALYTAYFMTPKLRGVVKPTIEVIEALPTVILGFLAGLWLAPFMEHNLPAVFALLIGLPLLMVLMSFLWSCLPRSLKRLVPAGWEAVLLVPALVLFGWAAVASSPWVETWLFDGSMRQWLTNQGITYDQRNALVVGLAMGFAVIPTIYSIAEDAIFNVPKHLTQGSLALGATPWQTMVGVVLPTASPGIFSGIMIGFGRAVGETMIVLMATGNSPIVNFNIFEGMRTLSANIAVELPETAVGSSHFRILFLAALVLFAFTFVLNTIAEVVRQRLRKRYSSL